MIPRSETCQQGTLNWHALERFPELLVRRSADRDEWVIGVRSHASEPQPWPGANGAWAGHLCYATTGVWDQVASRFPEGAWNGSHWWRPDLLLKGTSSGLLQIGASTSQGAKLMALLRDPKVDHTSSEQQPARPQWERHVPKARYLANVEKLLGHIQLGDIYEVNYCTERSAFLPGFDPFAAFGRLVERTDAPFAAFYRRGDLFALCMSPESFLRIEKGKVTTRPMKGTRPRSPDVETDRALAQELARDAKERSENTMAVDVARNDLSRVAASGSVRVEELCSVKTYPNVHQLVSTVEALLATGVSNRDLLQAAFPMASMTGAPKRRAMRLIDEVEDSPRGLFSGCLGYQLPDGTLDLNVVIRTIMYDATTGRASLTTGSAITAQSDPEREWEECELKARSVLDALF